MAAIEFFSIFELRKLLFECLAPYRKVYLFAHIPEHYRPQGLRCFTDIAHLGFTCKLICDHALNYLWCYLYDLKQLLALLPTFKTDEYISSGGKHMKRGFLTSSIEDEHWARFDFYACRVQRIYFGRDGVDRCIFEALLRRSTKTGKPILPNVWRFYWHEESFLHQEILPFISPTIKEFSVQPRFPDIVPYPIDSRLQSEEDELLIIRTLAERVPNLPMLFLDTVHVSGAAINAVALLKNLEGVDFVRLNHSQASNSDSRQELDDLGGFMGFNILENLEDEPKQPQYFTMGNTLFYRLSQIRHLRFLALNVEGLDCSSLPGPFPFLKNIRIHGDVSAKLAFLQNLQAPLLEIIWFLDEIPAIQTEEWTAIQPCMDVIADRFHDTVYEVLYERHHFKHFGPVDTSALCLIKPLFILRDLRDLRITVGDSICLSDDDVRDIFQGCPTLRSLQVDFIAGTTQPTPRCIEHAVKYAPYLSRWRFDLDFSLTPQSLQALQVEHTSVKNLNLIMRSLPFETDFDAIAAEILRIFPMIDVPSVVDEGYNPVWGHVLRKIAHLQGRILAWWQDESSSMVTLT